MEGQSKRWTVMSNLIGTVITINFLFNVYLLLLDYNFSKIPAKENDSAKDNALPQTENIIGDLHSKEIHTTTGGPKIYVIMPTIQRLLQPALVSAHAEVLSHVPNIHLILVEDSVGTSDHMKDILDSYHLKYTYIACSDLLYCDYVQCNRTYFTAQGSVQRNCGLKWLEYNENIKDGVVYFAAEDYYYSEKLYHEIKKTKEFAIFPVGGFPKSWVSAPLMKNGSTAAWLDPFGGRPWPLDLAGISFSVKHWHNSGKPYFYHVKETTVTKFVKALGVENEKKLEVLAENATKIYVWHKEHHGYQCIMYSDKDAERLSQYDNFKEIKNNFKICGQ